MGAPPVTAPRPRALAPLRFAPEQEAEFREWLRERVRWARVGLFLTFTLAFGLAPVINPALFEAPAALHPFLSLLESGMVGPLALLAAIATLTRLPQPVVQALQSSAVLAALFTVLALRALALQTPGMHYPAQILGIVLIAVAFFGAFHWRRIAFATLAFTAAGIALEMAHPADAPLLQAYTLALMAVIAMPGSYTQEYLARRVWWDLRRLHDARAAVAESESRFQAFMNHTPTVAWIKDAEGRYVFRNKAHRDRYGGEEDDWTGRHDGEFFPAGDAQQYAQTDREVLQSGQPLQIEVTNVDRHGRTTDWWIEKFPLRDPGGRLFVAGIGTDIAERKRLERELRESESRFQAFMDHNPALSWMKDESGRYLYMSETYRRFLGITGDDWRGRTDADYFPADFVERCRAIELRVLASGRAQATEGPSRDVSGTERRWLLVRFPFADAGSHRYIGGVATDVTERHRAEELVRLQSLTDELTGLYNRRGFKLLVEQQVKVARRQKMRCALMYIDVDGLKRINERHGHHGGDAALTAVAEALRLAVRNSDIVARLGGDEFTVFAVGCDSAEALRGRIQQQLVQHNASRALAFEVAVSIGFTEFDAPESFSLDALITQADHRMFAEKHRKPVSH